MRTHVILFLLLTNLLTTEYIVAQKKSANDLDDIKMGGLELLIDGIDSKDASAAFNILASSLVKRLSNKMNAEINFESIMYPDVNSLEEGINKKNINYFNLPTYEYFSIQNTANYVPFLSGTSNSSQKFIRYLLVTGANSNLKDINQLPGYKVSVSKSIEKTIGLYWLKATLREAFISSSYKKIIFQNINQSESESLLSVFFGKTDCVLISESTYELACELNPSIKSKTRILKKSQDLVSGLFVYVKGENPSTIKTLMNVAIELHKDNEGKQILNLFKLQRIFSISEADLSESRKVVMDYNKYFKGN